MKLRIIMRVAACLLAGTLLWLVLRHMLPKHRLGTMEEYWSSAMCGGCE
jgi:hypothetical protein